MQVEKVLGCAEFWETYVSHHPIDLGPTPFAINPFILDIPVIFLGHLHPIFNQIPYTVDVVVP
jgi:hypothetical protein